MAIGGKSFSPIWLVANEARDRESQLKEILLERFSRLAGGARSAPETIEEKQLKSKHIGEESGEGGTLIKGFRIKTSRTMDAFRDLCNHRRRGAGWRFFPRFSVN